MPEAIGAMRKRALVVVEILGSVCCDFRGSKGLVRVQRNESRDRSRGRISAPCKRMNFGCDGYLGEADQEAEVFVVVSQGQSKLSNRKNGTRRRSGRLLLRRLAR